MKSKILLVGMVTMALAFSMQAQGLVGKLKQKAEEAAEKALGKNKTGAKHMEYQVILCLFGVYNLFLKKLLTSGISFERP